MIFMLKPPRIFDRRLTKGENAAVTILIHEIQKLNPNDEIKDLLHSWTVGNGLHPENVRSSVPGEVRKLFRD